jgi:hypothetical protein
MIPTHSEYNINHETKSWEYKHTLRMGENRKPPIHWTPNKKLGRLFWGTYEKVIEQKNWIRRMKTRTSLVTACEQDKLWQSVVSRIYKLMWDLRFSQWLCGFKDAHNQSMNRDGTAFSSADACTYNYAWT